jgi:hypothetical protein
LVADSTIPDRSIFPELDVSEPVWTASLFLRGAGDHIQPHIGKQNAADKSYDDLCRLRLKNQAES